MKHQKMFHDNRTNYPWFLLQTKPHESNRAELNLVRQAIQTFNPKQKITSKNGTSRLVPLFAGYLFASFSPRKVSYTTVSSTFGVSRLITNGYNLEMGLPKALINGLIERCDENSVLKPPDKLEPGESIRILTGPFSNYIATVENLSTPERVRVFIDLMGRSARAEISVSEVERT